MFSHKNDRRGFTLTELLVVIAIITILASIVVPNVVGYIEKANVTNTIADIKNAETQLKGILSDAGVSRFRDLLDQPGRLAYDNSMLVVHGTDYDLAVAEVRVLLDQFNIMFYELLRRGRDANYPNANTDLLPKLGTSYMNIEKDAWDNNFLFWMGPDRNGVMLLRSYRAGLADQGAANDIYLPFVWDGTTQAAANADLPGQPPADNVAFEALYTVNPPTSLVTSLDATLIDDPDGRPLFAFGIPAPNDLPVYIFSAGPNEEIDAMLLIQMDEGRDLDFLGGGDDINNWDNGNGWDQAPQ